MSHFILNGNKYLSNCIRPFQGFKKLVKGIHESAKIGDELMIEVANPWKLGTSWMLLRISQHMMVSRDVQRPTKT